MVDAVAKSIGHHGHWGLSSGFDFLAVLSKPGTADNDRLLEARDPINILLIQPGDIRHIILTISRRRRHCVGSLMDMRPIHFYLFEPVMEVLARELTLLQVLNDYQVPIRQRANTYLEIYGNLKVQKRTCEYIEQQGRDLKLLSSRGRGKLDHVLRFDHLNYRDRDQFERALDCYSTSATFDIDGLLDHRQRGLYEDRFDARKAMYDWDYHASIKSKASIIHLKTYKNWRHTGIAFEFGDQTYSEPNRTMMTYTEGFMKRGKEKGMKKEVQGYWGDIVCSPYFAIGIDSDVPNKYAEGLYEIMNKNTGTEQHRHHAVEVSLYNLYSMLFEIETGRVYKMTKPNDIYSGFGALDKVEKLDDTATPGTSEDPSDEPIDSHSDDVVEAAQEESTEKKQKDLLDVIVEETEHDEDVVEAPQGEEKAIIAAAPNHTAVVNTKGGVNAAADRHNQRERAVVQAIQRAETVCESYHGVQVYPVTGSMSITLSKTKFQGLFDGVFVSSRAAQIIGEQWFRSLSRSGDSTYVVETGKYLVSVSKDVQAEVAKKEVELALKSGLVQVGAPIASRKRDASDTEEELLFFRRAD